jgi:hypothetical protein
MRIWKGTISVCFSVISFEFLALNERNLKFSDKIADRYERGQPVIQIGQ